MNNHAEQARFYALEMRVNALEEEVRELKSAGMPRRGGRYPSLQTMEREQKAELRKIMLMHEAGLATPEMVEHRKWQEAQINTMHPPLLREGESHDQSAAA